MTTKDIGDAGEEQARRFLISQGFAILACNYRAPGGELDLIARDGDALVFVEVKKRASNAFGGPLAAITKTKQERVALAAAHYIKEKKPKFDSIRFDAVCILPGRVEHLKNAFTPRRMNI